MGPMEVGRKIRELWTARFPDSVRTVWPGERVSTSGLTAWVELWTNVWSRRSSREKAEEWNLVVTAQVFTRDRLHGERVAEVVELVRSALERQTVTWSEGETTGSLRLFDVESEELTRREAGGWSKDFAHVVVRCEGTALAVESGGS